jgi:flagellar basal body-associated protein FliL
MTDTNATDAGGGTKGGRGRRLRSWQLIGLLLLVIVAALSGGAGYWYWMRPAPAQQHVVAPPFYLDLKPFVVSLANGEGSPYLVQLGISLELPGKDAGDAVTSILPELQDTLRDTVLAFTVDDVVTPKGVNRLRQAMVGAANRLLERRLGAARVKELTAGNPSGALVQNIFFPTLVVD